MNNTTFNNDFQEHIELPTLEEVYVNRKNEQLKFGKMLDRWISFSDDDIRKLVVLYPMFDAHLFYDSLSQQDIKKFANELSRMSNDMENFSVENLNFFRIGADFFHRYSESPQSIIDDEEDLKFGELTEQFFVYNSDVFRTFENGITRKSS